MVKIGHMEATVFTYARHVPHIYRVCIKPLPTTQMQVIDACSQ